MPGYLSLTLLDGFDRVTTKRIEFQDNLLLADYILDANQFMVDLDAVTDLQILRASMVLQDGLSLPAKDPTGSNVDVGGTFVGFVEGGAGKKATFKVPGIDLALVGEQGTIDITQVAVETLLNHFVDGSTEDFYLSDGEEIDAWITGTLDK